MKKYAYLLLDIILKVLKIFLKYVCKIADLEGMQSSLALLSMMGMLNYI